MKVMLIGSVSHIDENDKRRRDAFMEAARQIGEWLAENEHTIVVTSDKKTTFDYHAVEAAKQIDDRRWSIEVCHGNDGKKPFAEEIGDKDREEPNETEDTETGQDTRGAGERQASDTGDESREPHPQFKAIPLHVAHYNVAQMLTVDRADAAILLGGTYGTQSSGMAAHMIGKVVIPVACFGGGAEEVGRYASSHRQKFFFAGLNDEEVDELCSASRWTRASAEFVGQALNKVCAAQARKRARPGLRLAVILTLIGLFGWSVVLLWFARESPVELTQISGSPPALHPAWSLVGILLAVILAGFIGSSMAILRRIRSGIRTSTEQRIVDVLLGPLTGFVSALLYLVTTVAVNGEVSLPDTTKDFMRIMLLTSLIGIFASLFLDKALLRLEGARDSVLSGQPGSDSG